MSAPLLQTKLYIPPARPELVSRPRLLRRLTEGLERRLTLVSAPAGFGKTTLLSECAATCGRPVAWVSLDERDDDTAQFWTYVIAALQAICAGLGETVLAALQSRQPPTEALLTGLINEIAQSCQPFVLVLDDYHLISSQEVHTGVTFLLDNMPPAMHLVVATRADPPWPLARIRARDQMTEIRAADLRFTPEEVASFLNDVMGLGLSPQDIAVLDSRTEGWIAGLQMAALSMRGRKDVSGFVSSFGGSHRFVLDYLVEEVLDRQEPVIQDFLFKTSVLDRLTAPLCDAVAGTEDSHRILAQLDKANLFLTPLDDERRWYRYHHLFADLLRERLDRIYPGEAARLCLRASEWYVQNDLLGEAVSYALLGGDVERVARLVEGDAFITAGHGDLQKVRRQLVVLRERAAGSQPWLSVALAWVTLYTGDLGAVEPLLQEAERASEELESGLASRRLAGRIALLRAYKTASADAPELVEHATRAVALLPDDDLSMRAYALSLLATVYAAVANVRAGAEAAGEAARLARATGDSHLAVVVLSRLAPIHLMQGKLREAEEVSREALRHAEEYRRRTGHVLLTSGFAHIRLSQVFQEWNQLDVALRHARQGMNLIGQWGQVVILRLGHRFLAWLLQAMGDKDGALKEAREAERLAKQLGEDISHLPPAILLAQGDIAAAAAWAEQNGLSPDDHIPLGRTGRYRTFAWLLVAQGKWQQAEMLLERLREIAEECGDVADLMNVLILESLALHSQGRGDEALAALERALTLAQPEGYVRTFINHGAPMGDLLRKAVASGISVDYATRLLEALEGDPSGKQPETQRVPSPLIEPLSERELQVLRLLNTHLSQTDIARELVISANTVRTHVKSVYGKLGVHSRAEAVERASELGIL